MKRIAGGGLDVVDVTRAIRSSRVPSSRIQTENVCRPVELTLMVRGTLEKVVFVQVHALVTGLQVRFVPLTDTVPSMPIWMESSVPSVVYPRAHT